MNGDVCCMELTRAIDAYMANCHSRKLRPKTMDSYEQTLRLFAKWVLTQRDKPTVSDVTQKMIRDYLIELQTRGKYTAYTDARPITIEWQSRRRDFRAPITTTTINNYLRNIKAFFNWLVEIEELARAPTAKTQFLRNERHSREYLSDNQVLKLLKAYDHTYFSEFRDYTITLLLLDTGMRLGECLCQTLETLDLTNQSLFLDGTITKGRKGRTVFFSSKTAKELRRWIIYKDRYCPSDVLFPIKATGKPISIGGFESNFRHHLARVGIKEQFSPHCLRNNFAKRCLMSGMDIYTLSRILGHSGIGITEKAYLDIDDRDLKKRYGQFSPIDSLF